MHDRLAGENLLRISANPFERQTAHKMSSECVDRRRSATPGRPPAPDTKHDDERRRSATPRSGIHGRSPPACQKHKDEKGRSATPRRSQSPCNKHGDKASKGYFNQFFTKRDRTLLQTQKETAPRIAEEYRGRSATPVKRTSRRSVFKSVVDVLRGRTPPPGFFNRTPPRTPKRTPLFSSVL